MNFGASSAVNRWAASTSTSTSCYHSNAGLPVSAQYAEITSPRATRSCAVRSRWTTCASATPTTTSCARRANRTSCARPRTRSGSAAVRRPQGAAADLRRYGTDLHSNSAILPARLAESSGTDPRGALPRRHRAGVRDHLAHNLEPPSGSSSTSGLRTARQLGSPRASRRARGAPPRPGCPPASSTTRRAARTTSHRRARTELPALLPAGAAARQLDRRQPASTTSTTATIAARAYRVVLTPASTASTTACGDDLEVAADPRRLVRHHADGRRNHKLFYDGNRLRLVSWSTPRAVYWSNTLSRLTNPRCSQSRGR